MVRRDAFIRPSLTSVDSTLAPDTPDTRVNGDNDEKNGSLAMKIDELATILGGKGRAQIVWDCYSIVSAGESMNHLLKKRPYVLDVPDILLLQRGLNQLNFTAMLYSWVMMISNPFMGCFHHRDEVRDWAIMLLES